MQSTAVQYIVAPLNGSWMAGSQINLTARTFFCGIGEPVSGRQKAGARFIADVLGSRIHARPGEICLCASCESISF